METLTDVLAGPWEQWVSVAYNSCSYNCKERGRWSWYL